MAQKQTNLTKSDIKAAIAFWVNSGMPETPTTGVTIHAANGGSDPGHYAENGSAFVTATVVD